MYVIVPFSTDNGDCFIALAYDIDLDFSYWIYIQRLGSQITTDYPPQDGRISFLQIW